MLNLENQEHIAYRLGGLAVFALFWAAFFLLVTGQLSLGRLVSCVVSGLFFYTVVALLSVGAVSVVCLFVIKTPLTRVVKINYAVSLIVCAWFLWRTWKCLGITVNL